MANEMGQQLPVTRNLHDSLSRAEDLAARRKHTVVGLDHLLLAMGQDPDAVAVLLACKVDVEALCHDLLRKLGPQARVISPNAVPPSLDITVQNLIAHASAAAIASNQNEIDGANILSAIISGEGGMITHKILERHGLTFDEALKTLNQQEDQQNTQPPSQGQQNDPGEKTGHSPIQTQAKPPQSAPKVEFKTKDKADTPSAGQRQAESPTKNPDLYNDTIIQTEADPADYDISVDGQADHPTPPIQKSATKIVLNTQKQARQDQTFGENQRPPIADQTPKTERAIPPVTHEFGARHKLTPEKPFGKVETNISGTPKEQTNVPQDQTDPQSFAQNPPPPPDLTPPAQLDQKGQTLASPFVNETDKSGNPIPDQGIHRAAPDQQFVQAPPLPGGQAQHPGGYPPPPGPPQRTPPQMSLQDAIPTGMPSVIQGAREVTRKEPRQHETRGGHEQGDRQPDRSAPEIATQPPFRQAPLLQPQEPQTQVRMDELATSIKRSGQELQEHSQEDLVIENIPKVMRIGKVHYIEVRVARFANAELDFGQDHYGLRAKQDKIPLTKAFTVCLTGPDGQFLIDCSTASTQWSEIHKGVVDEADFAIWRWRVLPRKAGLSKLRLDITVRSSNENGITAEIPVQPSRAYKVKVTRNYVAISKRLLVVGLIFALGYGVAKYGQDLLTRAQTEIEKLNAPQE